MTNRRYSASYVIFYNSSTKKIERIKDGYVEIDQSGAVTNVGQESDHAKILKGVIVPGFINAHSHIELSHLKGAFKEATGMSGFINQINSLRESVGYEGRISAMKREFENLYRQGVVGVSDISNCNESFQLKKESKIYFRTFVELFGTEPQDAESVIESGRGVVSSAADYGIDASLTPHSCYTMSERLLQMTFAEGVKSGYISYHSQESPEEEDMIRYGKGALAENYKSRKLSTPPVGEKSALIYFINRVKGALQKEMQLNNSHKISGKINLVHNVVIDQDSIDYALANLSEPFFTICPLSNIFIHRELPPLHLMRENNLDICVGTDSLSSNKILDMVKELYTIQENFPSVDLGETIMWATFNGAKVIGKEDIFGSFEVGKKAGVVLIEDVDLDNLKLTASSCSRRLDLD